MKAKALLKKIRDQYVICQVNRIKIPNMKDENIHRYRVIFYGRVQKVGFRLEVCELAKRLQLTGFCRNLEDGSVLAEIQGPDDKIKYLISYLGTLKRIKITKKEMEELTIDKKEISFVKESSKNDF